MKISHFISGCVTEVVQGRGWIYNPSKGAWIPSGF